MEVLVKLMIVSALSVQVLQADSDICTTTCSQGTKCKDDGCLPCPPNSYQNKTRHRETFCKPWTMVTDYGWVIKRNGSAIEDIQWRCGDQYKMVEYTPGSYECRDIITSTTTATTTTAAAPNISVSTVGSTPTTATTVNDKTSPSGDDLTYVYVIIIPILLILAIAAVLYVVLKRKLCFSHVRRRELTKLEQNNGNNELNKGLLALVNGRDELDTGYIAPELRQLFDKVINIIGIRDCQEFLDGLNDARLLTSPGTVKNLKGFYMGQLSLWVTLNPELNHAHRVRASLDSIGYKLPPEPEVLQDTAADITGQREEDITSQGAENITRLREEDIARQRKEDIARQRKEDIARLMKSLEKAERLNRAFERLLLCLVEDLGTADGNSILASFGLTKDMEFREAEGKDFKNNVCAALLHWSYSYPCTKSDAGNQWFPLDELKSTLGRYKRNDILKEMNDSANVDYNDSTLRDLIRNYFNPGEDETVL
ncbi:unnamed protein product [Lymnaea stagnalis]|uniref:Death domain-containing protein n=1 Tax=Lymnaea stagnalis TaxID=6523 RepID=A0AAV2HS11_LYMST